jgi:hypothetical protein
VWLAFGFPPRLWTSLRHTHPGLALRIYAAAMRRDDDENGRLRGLIEGGLGTSAHSDGSQVSNAVGHLLSESRS